MYAEGRIRFSVEDLVEFARMKGLQVPDATYPQRDNSPVIYALDEECEAEIGYDPMVGGIELRWGETVNPVMTTPEVEVEVESNSRVLGGSLLTRATRLAVRNREIREKYGAGVHAEDLAANYELSTRSIYRIALEEPSKLELEVRDQKIREERSAGARAVDLAERYALSISRIYTILRGETQ